MVHRVWLPFHLSGLMQTRYTLLLIALLVVIAYVAGQWLAKHEAHVSRLTILQVNPCDPVTTECHASLNGDKVIIHFAEMPSALKPFKVTVKNEFSGVDAITVDFMMQGMDMGVNRVHLNELNDQSWSASAILPVCSLGRNDWIARLRIIRQDTVLQGDFNFRQVVIQD